MKRLFIIFLLFISQIILNHSFAEDDFFPFIYKLQKISYSELLNTNFNIGVIDIDEAGFLEDEIKNLKNQNKSIVTYLSIGEAENYRDYWENGDWDNNPPDFLEEENPEWEGNYKVEYWDPQWQEIIFKKIDDIISAGYSGIYLDIIDAYYYFEEKGRKTARQEMIDFVKLISQKAHEKDPNFLIIPQNAVELVEDISYLDSISGVGKEDTWFNDDKKIKSKIVKNDLKYLDKVIGAGKFVLAIDYPTEIKKQCYFLKQANKKGYFPFISNRDLDKIETVLCPH